MKKAAIKLVCVVFCVAFCVSCMIAPSFAAGTSPYATARENVTVYGFLDYDVRAYVEFNQSQTNESQLSLYSMMLYVVTNPGNSAPLTSLKMTAICYPSYSQTYTYEPYDSTLMVANQIKTFQTPVINRVFPVSTSNSSVFMFMGIGAPDIGAPEYGWNVYYYPRVSNSFESIFVC